MAIIINIVEFSQEYINKTLLLNYEDFYYETKKEIINFSINSMINNMINIMIEYFWR
jgi:hypothetical protein